ncbi:MAG TPA: VWA domain-containing protein [Chthoniobacteraceae bacterium]|jgi:hypothetical protein
MTFLAPWAVWFLAAVPLIVLLYLLKLKRRSMPVSTLMFWQRVLEESRHRALFQKLRQLLSLLLQLLIFALILGALAKPVFDRALREGASTVLIIDARARMQANEGGESRLSRARKLAAQYLPQASAQRQIAILSVTAAPTVAAPFSPDEKLLRERLEGITPSESAGDLPAAIQLARELLSARQGAKRIVVFTAPGALPEETAADVEIVPVGTQQDNLAITRFATRPVLNSPQTSEVLLEVVNFGRAAAEVNLELSFEGKLLDVKPLQLAAGAREVQIFPTVPRAAGSAHGWLTARLATSDALASDNVAYAVLAAPNPKRVLLVTKGNWFLEKLLQADQGVSFELLEPASFEAGIAARFDVVLFDNFLPGGFDLAQARGNFLFIKETPFSSAGAASLEQPLITETDAQHPVLRLVNLQNVTVVRASALSQPAAAAAGDWRFQSPIRTIEHPLMITGERRFENGVQRVAALALEITDSDLPLRVAFPLLISNTLQWLGGEIADAATMLIAGESWPLSSEQTVAMQPQKTWPPQAQPADEPRTSRGLFQPQINGYYPLRERELTRWIAVNTFSEAESDLRAAGTAGKISPSLPELSAAFSGRPLWHYLALAALLLLIFEWWLFHRRRTE